MVGEPTHGNDMAPPTSESGEVLSRPFRSQFVLPHKNYLAVNRRCGMRRLGEARASGNLSQIIQFHPATGARPRLMSDILVCAISSSGRFVWEATMALWKSRFDDHDLWTVVERARATMNDTGLPDAQAERDALDYAGMVLELLERRRNDTDGREISPAMLAATQNAATNFASQLDAVAAGQYTWQQLVPYVDEVITALGQWPPLKLQRYMSGISAAADSFRDHVLAAVDRVDARAGSLATTLEALEARQSELDSSVSLERQRITEAIATFTSTGDEAVRQWTDEHEDAIKARTDAWDAALESARGEADSHRARMDDYEAKSRKVLEAVGVNSTATDFGSYANDQGHAANTWRRVAATVFVIAGVWFIVSSLPWFTDGAELWQSSVARLGVTAAVAGVGAYAARESSQHRRHERQAKQVQLVLTALEPFIANLPERDQNAIRSESARAIFVLQSETSADGDQTLDGSYGDLLKTILAKVPDRGSTGQPA